MRKYWSTIIISVVIGCVLFMAGYLLGAKRVRGTGESAPEEVVLPDPAISVGNWQKWPDRIKENLEERKVIVAGLEEIAMDENEGSEERIQAFVLMAGTHSEKAIELLLENISLHLRKEYLDSDDATKKQQPCFYALKQMGWQVVPHALDFSNAQRSDKELDLLAKLFVDICGPRAAPAMLQAKIEEFTGDAMKTSAVKNIEQMLSHMRASNDAAQ